MPGDEVDLQQLAASVARHLEAYQLRPATWRPQVHQVPPPGEWYGWLLNAGRGAGKTAAASRYISQHVHGPPCIPGPVPHWVGIIAPTLGDGVTACFQGPSGIGSFDEDARLIQSTGGTVIRWTNGSQAKLFGAHSQEDVERLRAGGNTCCVWAEELAAWRYLDASWEQMRFGLRSGRRPHWIASTTPKPRKLIKKLIKETPHNVVVTHATTDDNPHLELHVRAALEESYGGLQIGRQELHAEILDQDANALWVRDEIDANRVKGDAPQLVRITVGVDPSGGAGEQGIVVAGKLMVDTIVKGQAQRLGHGYVLDDRTCTLPPDGWGRRAVQAAIDWEADDIVVEINFGGDMAVSTIAAAAEALGVGIPIRQTRASRGKRVRAEPVSVLTPRERWHHVGTFEQLEDQMCTWVPDQSDYSPDRLDAMVWTAWHQRLVGTSLRAAGTYGGLELVQSVIS